MSTAPTQVWLLEPEAAPGDSWWQGRPIYQLAVAAPWALREGPKHHVGNESPSLNAGFIDQRLYRARALAEAEGPRPEDFETSPVIVLAGPMQSTAAS
jgi:hypothetical protein